MTDHMLGSDDVARSNKETPCGQAREPRCIEEPEPLVTTRFEHVLTEDGHVITTGRDGETLQRCEDEPIHIPGAVQGFGLLIALKQQDGRFVVRIVSENAKRQIGYTPAQLFNLDSFSDILSDEEAERFREHVDFVEGQGEDVAVLNDPQVFKLSILTPSHETQEWWCAIHINKAQPHLLICEFEPVDDNDNPLVSTPLKETGPELGTTRGRRFIRSTQKISIPSDEGEVAYMEVLDLMSHIKARLAAASTLDDLLKVLADIVFQITSFHRVMVYQFDNKWNGRVVTERVETGSRAQKQKYNGLHFPASDIPKQARELYKINKVRLLYDRDQETARLVCRSREELETPLDLTFSFLRAMSPIHIEYLGNMDVRSSISISLTSFGDLWGLISCHNSGSSGARISFPTRKLCSLLGDAASENIERLSYVSMLEARKLISTAPTKFNPSGYIVTSSKDLLDLFGAECGVLSVGGEIKPLGLANPSLDMVATIKNLQAYHSTEIITSTNIKIDFPDWRYTPDPDLIAGFLLVPLSEKGQDFIVFFRKAQLKQVKWAGNPYKNSAEEQKHLEPRKSFHAWGEIVVGTCSEWTQEVTETAAVMRLIYGRYIEIWRQKEGVLKNDQLTRVLLANTTHEVRTPLNAIINYLEIALEGVLSEESREQLLDSHLASQSLIYLINDMLDLTKTAESGEVNKHEPFDLRKVLREATGLFAETARRKGITFLVSAHPAVPVNVIGDARGVRQAISNVTSNAVQATRQGGIGVQMLVTSRDQRHVQVEVEVSDTGTGISPQKLETLSRELEHADLENDGTFDDISAVATKALKDSLRADGARTLGVGLAVAARVLRNTHGQLRLKTQEGAGSRFVLSFAFELPASEVDQQYDGSASPLASPGQESRFDEAFAQQLIAMSTAEEKILVE